MSMLILTWIIYYSGLLLSLMLAVITLTTCKKKKPKKKTRQLHTRRIKFSDENKTKTVQTKSCDPKSLPPPQQQQQQQSYEDATGGDEGKTGGSAEIRPSKTYAGSNENGPPTVKSKYQKSQVNNTANNTANNTVNDVFNATEATAPASVKPARNGDEQQQRKGSGETIKTINGNVSSKKSLRRKKKSGPSTFKNNKGSNETKTGAGGIEDMVKKAARKRKDK